MLEVKMHQNILYRANSSCGWPLCPCGDCGQCRTKSQHWLLVLERDSTLLILWSNTHPLNWWQSWQRWRIDVKRLCAAFWGRKIMFLFLFRDITIVLCMHPLRTAGLTFYTNQASENSLAYRVLLVFFYCSHFCCFKVWLSFVHAGLNVQLLQIDV